MNKMRLVRFAFYAGFLLLAMLLFGCSGISECNPDGWGDASFDIDRWASSESREKYYNNIKANFVGLNNVEIEARLGPPLRISSDGLWIYHIGKVGFMQCGFYSNAFMILRFSAEGHVDRIGYYLD